MSKFKKEGKKSAPAVSTASLPDIVFMLLFFFMVTTVMRETEVKVEIKKPEATETTKLEKKSLVDYIYIGKSMTPEQHGTGYRIQLDDQIVNNATQVQEWKRLKIANREEPDQPFITTSLKVDKKTPMGIVTRVKHELREVDALKINYSTAQARVKN